MSEDQENRRHRNDTPAAKKKAYKPPELVKRGPLAKVAAFTPFIPTLGSSSS